MTSHPNTRTTDVAVLEARFPVARMMLLALVVLMAALILVSPAVGGTATGDVVPVVLDLQPGAANA